MNGPLDFTAAGRRTTPPPAAGSARPPGRRRARPVLAACVVAAGVVAAGLVAGVVLLVRPAGHGSGPPRPVVTASPAAKAARYCQVAAQFEQLAPGAPVPAGRVARFLRDMGPTIDEMRADAPADIGPDVAAVVAALRQAAAGDPSAMRGAGFAPSRRRLAAFRSTSCPAGFGTDEQ